MTLTLGNQSQHCHCSLVFYIYLPKPKIFSLIKYISLSNSYLRVIVGLHL